MEIVGVVEKMSYRVCPCCGERDHVFGHGGGERLAARIGVPLLGQVPLEDAFRAGSDDGMPLQVRIPTRRPRRRWRRSPGPSAAPASPTARSG